MSAPRLLSFVNLPSQDQAHSTADPALSLRWSSRPPRSSSSLASSPVLPRATLRRKWSARMGASLCATEMSSRHAWTPATFHRCSPSPRHKILTRSGNGVFIASVMLSAYSSLASCGTCVKFQQVVTEIDFTCSSCSFLCIVCDSKLKHVCPYF